MGLFNWRDEAPPPPKVEPPGIGQLDHLEPMVGLRGHGKSTHGCRRALMIANAAGGAYVIGHSLGARMPLDVDGVKLPITYHETIDELARGVQRKPGRWHILVTGKADQVLLYGRQLAESLRREAWYKSGHLSTWKRTKRMDGIPCVPVIIVIDEGIALAAGRGGAQGGVDDDWFKEFIFGLRHEHVCLIYSIQEANARTYLMLSQASTIFAFRSLHEWSLNSLAAAGFRSRVHLIPELPRYEYLELEVAAAKRGKADLPKPPPGGAIIDQA